MTLETGTTAPDFTLPAANAEAETVNLEEATDDGAAVLAFFPLAFTSGCTTEVCTFRDRLEEFEEVDAQVFGISVDSPPTLERFAEDQNLNFPLLSDFNREVIGDFGGFHEDLLGLQQVARRAVFVVDEDREVVFSWVTDDPSELPPFDEVRSAAKTR